MILIQNDIASEFLADEEVQELTGSKQLKQQMDWLNSHSWQYTVNRKNAIKIGRWYARIKLSGVAFSDLSVDTQDLPHFNKVS